MNRKEITRKLTDILICDRLIDRKYYAKEVTLDYGTAHPKRIDVMQFIPQGVMHVSDIEKGIFICYEVKSCKEDVYSGNGLNFYGDENYIVTTMQTYKDLQDDLREGKLDQHIKEFMGLSRCPEYGFLVPVPDYIDLRDHNACYDEFANPTPLDSYDCWHLWKIYGMQKKQSRSRSMTELLFCMLRAKHNSSN
jgi:hypothetical protein